MGKFRQYAYALLLVFLLNCSTKKEKMQQVLQLREMGELATTEYTVTKIVKANDNRTWYKIGDRKILLSVEARIKAGTDLSKLKPEQVQIDGKQISLLLPPPKLIALNIPPEKIKVEYEETGLLRQSFNNAERDALIAQAEQQIRAGIGELGILSAAEKSTRQYIQSFLRQLGYETIEIRFDEQSSLQNISQ